MPGLLGGGRSFPGIWGDPQPRVVGGAPPMVQLPNNMNVAPRSMAPAAPQSLGARVGAGLGTLFGGANDPNLSAEQNRQAQMQAMLQAGLHTILASENGGSGLGAIAQGALAGQQAGGQARQIAYMTTQEERLKQALSDPELVATLSPQQQRLLMILPPMEATKMLAEILMKPEEKAAPLILSNGARAYDTSGNLIAENAMEEELVKTDLGDRFIWHPASDPTKVVHAQRKAASPSSAGPATPSYQYKEIDGKAYNYDSNTGALVPIAGAPEVRTPTGANTDGARRAAGLLGVIEDANKVIDNYEPTNRDRLGKIPLIGDDLLSDEGQVAAQAARQLAQSYLYVVSGAQASESEIDATAKTYLPLPSDSPANLERKRSARLKAIDAVRSVAGMPSSDDPFGDL